MYSGSLADPGTHTDAMCPGASLIACMSVAATIIVCKCCNLPYLNCYVVMTYRRNPSCQIAACGCADEDPAGGQARQVGGVLWSVWRHRGVGHVLCCGHLSCSGSLLSAYALPTSLPIALLALLPIALLHSLPIAHTVLYATCQHIIATKMQRHPVTACAEHTLVCCSLAASTQRKLCSSRSELHTCVVPICMHALCRPCPAQTGYAH